MRLLNLSEIMDKSIDILRKNIKSIALFSLGYGVIALAGIIGIILFGSILVAIAAVTKSVVFGITILTILTIFLIAFAFSYYIGIIKITSKEFSDEKIFAHTAIKASLRNIFKVFVIVLIGTIAFLPVLAAFGGLGYVLYKAITVANIVYGTGKGKELGFAILVIIYVLGATFSTLAFMTWFSFTLHTLVLEKQKIFKSIKRSFYLVRRNYWKVFGSTVLFTLTVAALRLSIDLLLSTGASLIYLVFKLFNVNQDYITFISLIYSYANWPLSLILFLIITPIGAIMLTILYYNQRFKKEGFDLQLRLKDIEINEERKQLSETAQFNSSF